MQITLNIDIEGMFQIAIDKYVQNNLVVNNVKNAGATAPTNTVQKSAPGTHTVTELLEETATPPAPKTTAKVDYEFAPGCTPRRSPEQIAFHKLELEYGRRLTPAEKGETEAVLEANTEEQEKARIAAKDRIRIGGYIEEADKVLQEEEAAEQPSQSSIFDEDPVEPVKAVEPENIPLVAPAPSLNGGSKIPETDALEDISKLFN
jgi:hypothetical protein